MAAEGIGEGERGPSREEGSAMKRLLTIVAATALAAGPAPAGLMSNSSFAGSVPVRSVVTATATPSAASPGATADDHGRRHGGRGSDDGAGAGRRTGVSATPHASPTADSRSGAKATTAAEAVHQHRG